MPIYEYQCQECGHQFDKLQKISDEPLLVCPQCQKPKLVKLISAAGFRLKGAGWYETDFKKGKQKNLSKSGSDSTAASSAGAGSSTSADSSSKASTKSDTSKKSES